MIAKGHIKIRAFRRNIWSWGLLYIGFFGYFASFIFRGYFEISFLTIGFYALMIYLYYKMVFRDCIISIDKDLYIGDRCIRIGKSWFSRDEITVCTNVGSVGPIGILSYTVGLCFKNSRRKRMDLIVFKTRDRASRFGEELSRILDLEYANDLES